MLQTNLSQHESLTRAAMEMDWFPFSLFSLFENSRNFGLIIILSAFVGELSFLPVCDNGNLSVSNKTEAGKFSNFLSLD